MLGQAGEWLYHGSPRTIEEKSLFPRLNRTIAGENGHFIFATDYLLSGIVYALKTDDMLACEVIKHNDKDYTVCIIANRDKFLCECVNGRVYRLPKTQFSNVLHNGQLSNEWVSMAPVNFAEENSIPVPGIDTVMDMGGQIFFLKDGIGKGVFFEWAVQNPLTLQNLTTNPMFYWENRERGLST